MNTTTTTADTGTGSFGPDAYLVLARSYLDHATTAAKRYEEIAGVYLDLADLAQEYPTVVGRDLAAVHERLMAADGHLLTSEYDQQIRLAHAQVRVAQLAGQLHDAEQDTAEVVEQQTTEPQPLDDTNIRALFPPRQSAMDTTTIQGDNR